MNKVFQLKPQYIKNETSFDSGEPVIEISNGKQVELIEKWLDQGIDLHLSTIIGQDEQESLDLYYYFIDRQSFEKIILKIALNRSNPETSSVDHLTNTVFYEAELTEMLGVKFQNQDLEQVFLPETWDRGYPLRKDWEETKS